MHRGLRGAKFTATTLAQVVHQGVASLLQPVEGDAGVDGTAD